MMRAPADRCPVCCHPRPARPYWTPRPRDGQITAWYRCKNRKACKARWLVCWLATALGEASAA